MRLALAIVAAFLLTGCGTAKVEIIGTGHWAVFSEQGEHYGHGVRTVEVARRQQVTVQLLSDGYLAARIVRRHAETEWRPLDTLHEATVFYVE